MKRIAFLDVLTGYGLGLIGLALVGMWHIYSMYPNGFPRDYVAIVDIGGMVLIFVLIPVLLFGMTKLANFALAMRRPENIAFEAKPT